MINVSTILKGILLLSVVLTGLVEVKAATLYVATNGVDSNSGADWTQPVATISNAVGKAGDGDTILVSNGYYTITAQITLVSNLTVRGFSGNPADVTVNGGTSNIYCFSLTNASTVENLTTTNAAGGFYLNGTGTVRRCVISNNRGAGSAQSRSSTGVFLYRGGLVENCVIINCAGGDVGGAACLNTGGILRNCLVTKNEGFYWGGLGGGGVYMSVGNGRVENCTIVDNTGAGSRPGGVYNYSGNNYVYNSIVVSNIVGGGITNYNTTGNRATFYYSCTTPMPALGANNITNDPQFTTVGGDIYRLSYSSPCVNAGTNLNWVTNATYLAGQADLAGNRRVIRSIVDMGAYEWQPPAGTVFGFR